MFFDFKVVVVLHLLGATCWSLWMGVKSIFTESLALCLLAWTNEKSRFIGTGGAFVRQTIIAITICLISFSLLRTHLGTSLSAYKFKIRYLKRPELFCASSTPSAIIR